MHAEARDEDDRRDRARSNARLLAVLAVAFYLGFILLSAAKSFMPGG